MDPSTYGDRIADVYDDWYADATDVEGTVETVARYGPRVLELGIGTGRLAVPMVEAGLTVHGVDASAAMVARLWAKAGERIPVVLGDFADVPVTETYDVVLLAFNALLNLTDEDDQVRCLRRCGEVAPRVVVETFVPAEDAPAQGMEVRRVGADEVALSAFRVTDGVVDGSIISITESGIRLRPWQVRLTGPERLDALAARAGLQVEARWAGWRSEPFGPESDRCVTVFRGR